jgi:hypothetical protein
MMMTKFKTRRCALALAVLFAAGGCHSEPAPRAPDGTAGDEVQQNRLLIRMALAENVYNGAAAERAIYPHDFQPDTAILNELGTRRLQTLAHACRDANGHVTVVRGDETDKVYDARVSLVRQQLADAGVNVDRVSVARGGPVGGGGTSSDTAILTYNRMMSDYSQKHNGNGGGGGTGGGMSSSGSSSSSPGYSGTNNTTGH